MDRSEAALRSGQARLRAAPRRGRPTRGCADRGAVPDREAAGYAVTDGEVDAGVWGVSVPLFQRAQVAAASITLMAPSTRAAQRPQALIDMTLAAAGRISARLQGR